LGYQYSASLKPNGTKEENLRFPDFAVVDEEINRFGVRHDHGGRLRIVFAVQGNEPLA
jgi:hypothetical protein